MQENSLVSHESVESQCWPVCPFQGQHKGPRLCDVTCSDMGTSVRANIAKVFTKFVRFDCTSETVLRNSDQKISKTLWYLDCTPLLEVGAQRETEISEISEIKILKIQPCRNRMTIRMTIAKGTRMASCRAHPTSTDFAWPRCVCQDIEGKVAMCGTVERGA